MSLRLNLKLCAERHHLLSSATCCLLLFASSNQCQLKPSRFELTTEPGNWLLDRQIEFKLVAGNRQQQQQQPLVVSDQQLTESVSLDVSVGRVLHWTAKKKLPCLRRTNKLLTDSSCLPLQQQTRTE